ncbi:VanZ family protein [Phenylobacterium sp.]|jgi:VanZ family protein|uniref:VanZ family protein n=1 Tax=Phenylobacterium sp. TaxID=1871053 RepID=UPI002F939009
MLPHRLPRPLRLALYALASAVLLYICLAPTDALPQPNLSDKVEHAAGWFVLTALGLTLSPRRPRAIAAYSLGLALAIEMLQAIMPLGRNGDWRDFVADAIGVAAAFLAAAAVRAILGSRIP